MKFLRKVCYLVFVVKVELCLLTDIYKSTLNWLALRLACADVHVDKTNLLQAAITARKCSFRNVVFRNSCDVNRGAP